MPLNRDNTPLPAAAAASASAGKNRRSAAGQGEIKFVTRYGVSDLTAGRVPVFGDNLQDFRREGGEARKGARGQASMFARHSDPEADRKFACPIVTCPSPGRAFFRGEKPTPAELAEIKRHLHEGFERAKRLLADGKTLLIPVASQADAAQSQRDGHTYPLKEGDITLGGNVGRFHEIEGIQEFMVAEVVELIKCVGIENVSGVTAMLRGVPQEELNDLIRTVQQARTRAGTEHSRTRGTPAARGAGAPNELPPPVLAAKAAGEAAAQSMTPDQAAATARRLAEDGVLEGDPDKAAKAAKEAVARENQMTPKEIKEHNAAFDEALRHKKFKSAATDEMLVQLTENATMLGPKFALGFMEELNKLTQKGANDKGDLYLGVLLVKALCWLIDTPFKVGIELASRAQEKYGDSEELDLKKELDAKYAKKGADTAKKASQEKPAEQRHGVAKSPGTPKESIIQKNIEHAKESNPGPEID